MTRQSGTISQPYTYTGREWDAETGLYYYRARYYDPQAGRFITEDPIGIGGGVNYYTYVLNDPIDYTDPFGLEKCCGGLGPVDAIKFYKKINKAIQAGKCGKAMDPIVRAWQECYKEFEQCKTLEDQLKFYDKYTNTAFVSFAVLGCVKKKSGDPNVYNKWFEACIKFAY
jgi:RHS repeat-associated protein